MNKILENEIVAVIKSSNVVHTAHYGTDVYNITNRAGKEIISVANGYDYGQYDVSVNGQTVASVKWRENVVAQKTPEQQSVFNIIRACVSRRQELEQSKGTHVAPTTMNPTDKAAFMFLKSLQNVR